MKTSSYLRAYKPWQKK